MKLSFPDIRPKFLVDQKGKKTAVLLDMHDYQTIMHKLEDWYDILTIESVKKLKLPTFSSKEIETEVLGKKRRGR